MIVQEWRAANYLLALVMLLVALGAITLVYISCALVWLLEEFLDGLLGDEPENNNHD